MRALKMNEHNKPSAPTRRRRLRRSGRAFLGALLGALVAGGCIYATVERDSQPIYSDARAVPAMPVAIVFGAGIRNAVVDDRVLAAVDLYRAGKVCKLLMTGDNGRAGYDEPGAMRATALAAGVPAADVACDYAGFRTYDSLYRARNIFGVHDAVLVTQRYHLPRALYLGRRLGLTVVGLDAARHSYGSAQRWWDLREVAAVEAAWLDVNVTHRRPKFLGKHETL
jgi:SanA protein